MPKPPLEQHDFGGVFGGPVDAARGCTTGSNKTFFFSSYEAYRNKTSAAPMPIDTIPTAEMYNGDFSNWRDANGNLIPIYDPATTRVNPNGPGFMRDPFPDNQIPLDRFSQISRNVLAARDDAAGSAGCAQQLHLHAGRPTSIPTPGTSSASSSITTCRSKDRLGFLFHWGEVLVIPPSGGPGGRAARCPSTTSATRIRTPACSAPTGTG